MKFNLSLLFSTLVLSSTLFANQPQISPADLAKFNWQAVNFSQKIANKPQINVAGLKGAVGYKIPANQGTLKITIQSAVTENNTIFVPNVLVLDAQFNPSVNYPASQFKFEEARGINEPRYETELSLTPTANQDFIYLLVYTTEADLKGTTTVTHPAKMLAKAKGTQPPAIADIQVKHSETGKIQLEVDGVQSAQFVGLGSASGALFEKKSKPTAQPVAPQPATKLANKTTQPVESSTEQYFNNEVLKALKANDVNKAMNLVNEAEQLGLKQPRQLFIKHISIQK